MERGFRSNRNSPRGSIGMTGYITNSAKQSPIGTPRVTTQVLSNLPNQKERRRVKKLRPVPLRQECKGQRNHSSQRSLNSPLNEQRKAAVNLHFVSKCTVHLSKETLQELREKKENSPKFDMYSLIGNRMQSFSFVPKQKANAFDCGLLENRRHSYLPGGQIEADTFSGFQTKKRRGKSINRKVKASSKKLEVHVQQGVEIPGKPPKSEKVLTNDEEERYEALMNMLDNIEMKVNLLQ